MILAKNFLRGMPFRKVVIGVAIAFSVLLLLAPPSFASSFSDSGGVEQAAVFVDLNGEQSIPIYLRPAPNQPTVGYGVSGNPVTVLDQVGDYLAFDDPQATWCHIRIEVKPYLEGWTQAKYLEIFESSA